MSMEYCNKCNKMIDTDVEDHECFEKEELKTLKEMDLIDMEDRKGYTEEVIRIEELKQEAIKHSKAIEEKKGRWSRQDTLNWIKHFFNITSEDLE